MLDESPPALTWRNVTRISAAAGAALLLAMLISYVSRPPDFPVNFDPQVYIDESTGQTQKPTDESQPASLPDAASVAAREDHSEGAEWVIGEYYLTGLNGAYRADYCKAVMWYDLGARRKQIYPSMMLSIHYLLGQGVKRDPKLAYFWYRHAQEQIAVYPQVPWMDYPTALRSLELMHENYNDDLREPSKRVTFEAEVAALDLEKLPPPVPQPTWDIPIIGQWMSQIVFDSAGCHGPLMYGFQWLSSAKAQYEGRQWNEKTGRYDNFSPILLNPNFSGTYRRR